MARIWSEPFDPNRHQNPMGWEVERPELRDRYWRAPTLVRGRVLFVRVCGFTFEFHSSEQLRACLAFYTRKLHPSGRSPAAAQAVRTGEVAWRHEVERWHERLPLYLREEPKRQRVVAALEEALRRATAGEFDEPVA